MKSLAYAILLCALWTHPMVLAATSNSEPTETDITTPATPPADEDQAAPSIVDPDDDADEFADDDLDDPYLVGWLKLDGALVEGPPRFSWTHRGDQPASTQQIVDQLHRVADDPNYLGVTVQLDQPMLTLTQIQEITTALRAVRDAGQTVLVCADHYDLHTYLLAGAADKVVLQTKGLVELSGLGIEETYLAGLLELVGAKADMVQLGRYKGADESLTRTGPSDAWSSNIDALLDDLYGLFVNEISKSRGLEPGQLERLMRQGWGMTDEQYVESGLVDHIANRDLIDVTGLYYGDDFEWDDLLSPEGQSPNLDNPFAVFSLLFKEPRTVIHRPSLAVVYVLGPIVTGESDPGGILDSESVGSSTMVDVLADARDNDLIKGVVLRIDSPGGSALASELIWQAVRELGDTKPVYASIGPMAASGGYYIACAAHEIYASPGSILGSIGVVGGKIILGGLYEKIGVSVHRRSRGPLGDMFNSVEAFSEDQRAVIHKAMQRVYDQFTDRVAIGRGQRVADIDAVAQGRLFTGRQSVRNGLADQTGGLDAAIEDLAAQLDLEPGSYDVIDLPKPLGLSELLENWFAVQARGAPVGASANVWIDAARATLGPQRWRAIAPILRGTWLLRREHVLTLLPTAILVR